MQFFKNFLFFLVFVFIGNDMFARNVYANPFPVKFPLPHCYIYGHTDNLIVADIENAVVGEVAYSSFEDNTSGNWSFNVSGIQSLAGVKSITGKKYYSLTSGNVTKSFSPDPGKSIIVSYWSRSGVQTVNGSTSGQAGRAVTIDGYTWTFYEHVITNPTSITLSGSGLIDELRLYPEEASMTSFTYEPFVGIIAKCDINNNISYNEYDIFNRLSVVRDQDFRVIKKYCYGNAGQQEDCTGSIFLSPLRTGSFTRSNCGSGYDGSSVTYTVPAGTYVSSVDQLTADQMAQSDFDTNGPIYANINGTCTFIPPPPPQITIQGYNSKTSPYVVQFTNNSTGTPYSFFLSPNTFSPSTLGQVPVGTYTVLFYPNGAPVSATFNVNGFTQFGTGATFNNISVISTTTASMY